MNSKKLNRKINKLNVFCMHMNCVAELSESTSLKVCAMAVKRDFSSNFFGYNGSVPDAEIISNTGTEEESLESGKSGFVHAEMNLIAKFRETDPENYVVLLTHSPCSICAKLLINADFKYVYWLNEYRDTSHIERLFGSRLLGFGTIEQLRKFGMISVFS